MPIAFVAYNFEENRIRASAIKEDRVQIKEVEGKGKGAFLKPGGGRKGSIREGKVVGVYGGELMTISALSKKYGTVEGTVKGVMRAGRSAATTYAHLYSKRSAATTKATSDLR